MSDTRVKSDFAADLSVLRDPLDRIVVLARQTRAGEDTTP